MNKNFNIDKQLIKFFDDRQDAIFQELNDLCESIKPSPVTQKNIFSNDVYTVTYKSILNSVIHGYKNYDFEDCNAVLRNPNDILFSMGLLSAYKGFRHARLVSFLLKHGSVKTPVDMQLYRGIFVEDEINYSYPEDNILRIQNFLDSCVVGREIIFNSPLSTTPKSTVAMDFMSSNLNNINRQDGGMKGGKWNKEGDLIKIGVFFILSVPKNSPIFPIDLLEKSSEEPEIVFQSCTKWKITSIDDKVEKHATIDIHLTLHSIGDIKLGDPVHKIGNMKDIVGNITKLSLYELSTLYTYLEENISFSNPKLYTEEQLQSIKNRITNDLKAYKLNPGCNNFIEIISLGSPTLLTTEIELDKYITIQKSIPVVLSSDTGTIQNINQVEQSPPPSQLSSPVITPYMLDNRQIDSVVDNIILADKTDVNNIIEHYPKSVQSFVSEIYTNPYLVNSILENEPETTAETIIKDAVESIIIVSPTVQTTIVSLEELGTKKRKYHI